MKEQLIEEGIQWSITLTIPTIPAVRMEKWKTFIHARGSINDLTTAECNWAKPGKVNPCITLDYFNNFTFMCLEVSERYMGPKKLKKRKKRMFFSAFQIIAKKWKQAIWPSGVKWENKMGIICTVQPCTAVNLSELDLYHLHH